MPNNNSLLDHIPEKHQNAFTRVALQGEDVLLAENFPGFIGKNLLQSIGLFSALSLMVMFGMGLVLFALDWSNYFDSSILGIIILLVIWFFFFGIALAVFTESKLAGASGESLIVTNQRIIRVISPLRFYRAFTESFWYNATDLKWVQIREERSTLACYSILLQPPPVFEASTEIDNEISKSLPSFNSLIESQNELDWTVSPDDRVGFINLRATRETMMQVYNLLRDNAASVSIQTGCHHTTIDSDKFPWYKAMPTHLQGVLNNKEWNYISNLLQKIRVSPIIKLLPMSIIMISLVIIGLLCIFISDVVLLLYIANSYSILMTIFSINFIFYCYWYKLQNYIVKEEIDSLVSQLNTQFRDLDVVFINKGLKIEVKSLDWNDDV